MNPAKQTGYLLHHLSFVIDQQSDQILRERLGLGFSQFKILVALKWREGIQQKQIASYLGQTEASISRQIVSMKDKGWIESRVNPKNRREHVTSLTLKGQQIAEKAMVTLNNYHAPVFARLSEKQQLQLAEILGIMHSAICAADQLEH